MAKGLKLDKLQACLRTRYAFEVRTGNIDVWWSTINIAFDRSSVPTRFLPLTVSVIVRVRGKLVRLELEVTC